MTVTNRTAERFGDLVVLHVFSFLHQNHGTMFWRQLFDRFIDPCANFMPFHPFMGQSGCLRGCAGSRVDLF
jgi:hypothetical protein